MRDQDLPIESPPPACTQPRRPMPKDEPRVRVSLILVSADVCLLCCRTASCMPCASFAFGRHPHQRGSIYSVDESRRGSWTKELKAHIDKLQAGKGESGEKFSYRLIGSAVADVHRTLVRAEA